MVKGDPEPDRLVSPEEIERLLEKHQSRLETWFIR